MVIFDSRLINIYHSLYAFFGLDYSTIVADISQSHPFKRDVTDIVYDLKIMEDMVKLTDKLRLYYRVSVKGEHAGRVRNGKGRIGKETERRGGEGTEKRGR